MSICDIQANLISTNDRDSLGLRPTTVLAAVRHTHSLIAKIDDTISEEGGTRLADLVELANLSAIIGNLFRAGVVKNCGGRFKANGPHKYPDLLSNNADCENIEIKVALETNQPKGHLVKPGPHLTVRYVLCSDDGSFTRGRENRGSVPQIWEVRLGKLLSKDFNFSNTAGDSGKTAVINSDGLYNMELIYFDQAKCPYSPRGTVYKRLLEQSS